MHDMPGATEDSTRTASPDQPEMMKSATSTEEDYSPVPATVMSATSSPASASDFGFHVPDPTSTIGSSTGHTPNPLLKPQVSYRVQPPTAASHDLVAPPPRAAMSNKNAKAGLPEQLKSNEAEDSAIAEEQTAGTGKRRQKRLERNRESARMSRRRRKQYLEVLEEKVNTLSAQLDEGRRKHVALAVWTIQNKRLELLAGPGKDSMTQYVPFLETTLSRTNPDVALVNTFQAQQLKSFALPPSSKFSLWLSLQNDDFFRGGRANSERLSAARIGERMLSSGTNEVTPHQNMWPLFCNEVGLSYEQEEKVRAYQRDVLQTPETWLHRHTAFASGKTMETLHGLRPITDQASR